LQQSEQCSVMVKFVICFQIVHYFGKQILYPQ